MLAFNLNLLDDLFAIYRDLVVIAAGCGCEDHVFALLRGLEGGCVTDAPRGLVGGSPPFLFVVADVSGSRSLGRAAEVLTWECGLFDAALPFCLREDVVHLRQPARVQDVNA